ncbi:MAG TPA: HigA family addiction module antitoxin [Rhodocyclaceae bacterium]|nr:HigA family addiction module antitoxin [Rhodocyclaceae bacterium]HNL21208.1 HigA family addiction module antitoxin [Rhodocyclaceae bacterium]HNM23684.1 HigA family addiction module antitoxin [Rhodocyclaceae bacterium]HNM82009.1 HigA family addiction module antitoxin [Rhodocyclaceae bacterium]HNO89308.1 HigA family addiction module antitoxin [Rhodocyclaceae bacterium]
MAHLLRLARRRCAPGRNCRHPIGADMAELLDEIHPGEILLEDFMKPMGLSARQLAADIDVSPSRISELVNGNRPITADTALRLGLFFQMEPRFWLNLQTEYDMRVVTRTLQDKISPRIRVLHQAM